MPGKPPTERLGRQPPKEKEPMNGYQFAAVSVLGFAAIVIAFMYSPGSPGALADDLEACGVLPKVTYSEVKTRYGPEVQMAPDPGEFQIQTQAIVTCREQVIQHWKGQPK